MVFLFGMFIAARFIIEYFKENQETFEDGIVLNMGQWLSIPFILGGLGYMTYGYLPKKNKIPSI